MAKNYTKVFAQIMDQTYVDARTPLITNGVAALATGGGIRLAAMPVPGVESGRASTDTEYAVQRVIRVKGADTKENYATAYFDDLKNRYNTAQSIQWETVEMVKATKRDLLIKLHKNEEVDITTDGSGTRKAIADTAKAIILDQEEKAMIQLWDDINSTSAVSATDLDIDGTIEKDEAVVYTISKKVEEMELIRDKFKVGGEYIVLLHPHVFSAFGRVQGKAYYNGTNTFPAGLGMSFTYNGTEYYKAPLTAILDAKGTQAGKSVAGAIILDKYAFIAQAINSDLTEIDEIHLDTRLYGHSYSVFSKLIDTARVAAFTIPGVAKPGVFS